MLLTWLFVCWGAVICLGIQSSRIRLMDEPSTWWEAQSRCNVKGRLYTPGSEDIPLDLLNRLQLGTYYWIGAMDYLAWLWTEDFSPLYTYAGFLPLESVTAESMVEFLDNSVWKCHLHCSQADSVGMKETTCYCLKVGYSTTTSMAPESTCPGNLDEKCGNVQGMSVYRLENITFDQEPDKYCAYAIRRGGDHSIHSSTCENKGRCQACIVSDPSTHVYVYCWSKSWYDAYRTCHLVKLNTAVQNGLLSLTSTITRYWIGLYKYTHRQWINGEDALEYDEYRGSASSDTKCLSVYKQWNGRKRLYWRPCSEQRRFICEDETKSQPQGGVGTTDGVHSTEVTTPLAGRKDAMNSSSNPQAGGFIGLGIGCVLLVLAILIVVVVLRRQKKLCFKTKSGNQLIHFTSVTENTTYGLAVQAQTANGAYSVITPPDIDRTSTSSTFPTAIVRPNAHNDNIYINTSQINDEDEYNVLSESDNSKKVMPHGNPYNHLSGPDRGNGSTGDYDTANCVPQAGEATTGLKNTTADTRLSDAASSQNLEEGQYNVLGQHDSPRTVDADAGVYDHVAADEGDCDTTQQCKNPSKVDDTYSHIQRTNTECEEDAYDVASKRQPEGCSYDTYDHATKVDEEDRDTADYYNTKCLHRDDGNLDGHPGGDGRSDENDQENVYSLAKGISDA
ncbi:uncharacterized protein LOC124111951 isoform X2 [Haliotis rufescens]|uniref:uncharacterized protein LOC124111951 isoform X2 n=1 Tax=Haliotis rufescens TaxID=6454 RepID=UPI00201F8A5C|nr:uncharacterized protein LOC124111951 isoform X2 [Haliotis rufescens]